MNRKSLQIKSSPLENGVIFRLGGELFASTVPQLADVVDPLKEEKVSKVVLDLEGLTHIDSRGIGALVGWHRAFTNREVQFQIVNVPDPILQPLRVCHLDSVLEIDPGTPPVRSEAALRRERLWEFHEFALQILSGLEEGLIAVNLDNEVVYLNPGAEAILDCVEEDLIGKPLLDSLSIRNLTQQEFLQYLTTDDEVESLPQPRPQREVELERPDGEVVWVRFILTPIYRGGIKQGTVLNLVNITDEVFARQSATRLMTRLESLRKLCEPGCRNQGVEQTIESLLETVREIFSCDRAWLLHPCDPDAESYRVEIESTSPEFPGAKSQGNPLPVTRSAREVTRKHLEEEEPIVYDSEHPFPADAEWKRDFHIKAQMSVVVHTQTGKPWLFGIHHCTTPRTWTPSEKILFREIACRISDALNSLILERVKEAKEESLDSLIQLTSEVPGESFYQNLIRYVCRRLDVPHGFIGLLTDEKKVTTLAT